MGIPGSCQKQVCRVILQSACPRDIVHLLGNFLAVPFVPLLSLSKWVVVIENSLKKHDISTVVGKSKTK